MPSSLSAERNPLAGGHDPGPARSVLDVVNDVADFQHDLDQMILAEGIKLGLMVDQSNQLPFDQIALMLQ